MAYRVRMGVVVVGGFYELPCKKVAKVIGYLANKSVTYLLDDQKGPVTVHKICPSEFKSWIPRPELEDFPNASDPILPYSFDLFWDLKYLSQLKPILSKEVVHPDFEEIEKMAKDHELLHLVV